MRAAAGAGVHALDADNAHIAVNLLLAPVFDIRQFLAGRYEYLNRLVAPNRLIRQQLDAMHVLLGQRTVKIHRHRFRADMKAHIVITKNAVYQTGEHMLTAVLLHHIQPPHTVYMPMHLVPDLKRRTGQMLDLAPLLVRIQNPYIIQRAVVCALSAAFRKKRGLIEYNGIAAVSFFAADNNCGKIQLIHILLI